MSYNINQMHFPSTQIYLNSKYADAYGGIASQRSWCYFIFKEPIVKLPEAYNFLLSLNSIELPCSMYAVNSSNNVIKFQYILYDNASLFYIANTLTFTIPSGNYSAIDLATIMNQTFSFKPVSYATSTCNINVLYNQQNNKFQFQISTSQVNTILSANSALTIVNFSILAGSSNCIFGLSGAKITNQVNTSQNAQGITDVSGNLNLYSDVCVDLAGTRAVFVKCMNIHTPGYDSRTKYSGSVLARVPVIQEPFGITFWKNDTNFKCACSLKNVSNLEIQIVDEFGSLVDFNLIDWTMTLQLDIINASDESLTDFTPNVPFINNHV